MQPYVRTVGIFVILVPRLQGFSRGKWPLFVDKKGCLEAGYKSACAEPTGCDPGAAASVMSTT